MLVRDTCCRSVYCISCAIALFWSFQAPADDLPFLAETTFIEENPIISTASRLPQTVREAPVAVTVIDRQMIEASGAQSLPEVLRLVPGFIVWSPDGHTTSVTNHGLADGLAREIQVLVDGRSVIAPVQGGAPWHTLSVKLEDVDHIEVVRGPNAATFGANSFLGVINIVTKHASQDGGISAVIGAGSRQARKLHLRMGDKHGRLDHRFRIDYRGDDGFEEPDGAQDTDFKRVLDLATRFDYLAQNGDRWELQFGIQANELGAFGEPGPGSIVPPRSVDGVSDFELIRWIRRGTDGAPLSLRFSHDGSRVRDTYVSGPLPFVGPITISEDISQERFSVELEKHIWLSDTLHAVVGGEIREDRIDSDFLFAATGGKVDNSLVSAFGNFEWRASSKWLLQGGAMYEDFDIGGDSVSPRIAVNFFPNDRSAWRISVSKATRAVFPNEEMSSTILGGIFSLFESSGGLEKPEIVSHEIGYLGRVPEWNLSVDARVFHDQVTNLVTLFINNNGIPDLRNSDDATLRGVDFQLTRHFGEADRMILGYAYVEIDSTDRSQFDVKFSESGPRHNLHLLLSKGFSHGWSGSMGYYYWSKTTTLLNTQVPSANRLDLRLAKDFKLGQGTRAQIALVLQNLLDDHVEGPFQDVGRRGFLEFRLRP